MTFREHLVSPILYGENVSVFTEKELLALRAKRASEDERKRELQRIRRERWNENHKDELKTRKREYYLANKDKLVASERNRLYKKLYGITLEDYELMLKNQGGKCAICGSKAGGKKGQYFAVDHCHKSNAVRGLLCTKCNVSLGWFENNTAAIFQYMRITASHEVDPVTLSKYNRYRLKDIEGYRKRRRELSKTPENRETRRLYAKKWRDNQKRLKEEAAKLSQI